MKAYRQKEEFDSWIANAQSYEIKRFQNCARSYHSWQDKILNTFEYRLSHGPTEGLNNKMKVLK